MDFLYVWSPIFSALGAVALALLVVAGRHDPRRAALVAVGGALIAFCALFVTMVTAHLVALGAGGPANNGILLLGTGEVVYPVADAVTTLLTFGAWTLLLYAVAQTGSRWRLIALTLLFTLSSAVAIAALDPQIPLLQGLRDWLLFQSGLGGNWGEAVLIGVGHLATLAAAGGTFLLPAYPSGIPGQRFSGWHFP